MSNELYLSRSILGGPRELCLGRVLVLRPLSPYFNAKARTAGHPTLAVVFSTGVDHHRSTRFYLLHFPLALSIDDACIRSGWLCPHVVSPAQAIVVPDWQQQLCHTNSSLTGLLNLEWVRGGGHSGIPSPVCLL